MRKTTIYCVFIIAFYFLFSCTGNKNDYDDSLYKIRVEINSGDVEYSDKLIELNIN